MNFVEIGGRKIFVSLFVNVTFLQTSDLQPVYEAIVLIECVTLALIFGFATMYTRVFLQSAHFHLNLRRLYLFFTLITYPALLGRSVIIMFQFDVLSFPGPIYMRVIALLATYGRIILIVWEIVFVAAVVIERAAATLWIGFYETMQFTELSTLLLLLKLAISLVAITLITQLMYEFYTLMIFTLMPLVVIVVAVSFMLFQTLFSWNIRQLNELKAFGVTKDASTERYLSTRFQLEENVNALKLIRTITLFHAVATPMCAMFLAVPFYFMDLNTDTAQILLILFDLSIALTTLIYFVMVFSLVEPWRYDFIKIVRNLLGIRVFANVGKRATIAPVADVAVESEQYFAFYANAWH